MINLLILGGLARSGKSESLKILEKLGFKRYSTSELLHSIGADILFELFDHDTKELPQWGLTNKDLTWDFEVYLSDSETYEHRVFMTKGNPYTSREVLIKLAEEVLVKNLGRKNAFVIPTVEKLLADCPPLAVIESIGGTEWSLLEKELFKHREVIKWRGLNIRRNSEEPEADYRELLPPPAVSLSNDSTLEQLEHNLRFTLNMMGYNI